MTTTDPIEQQRYDLTKRIDETLSKIALIADESSKAEVIRACRKAYERLVNNELEKFGFPVDFSPVEKQLDWAVSGLQFKTTPLLKMIK